MKILGISSFKTNNNNSVQKNKTQQKPSFTGYNLLETFKDPNYSNLIDYAYELTNKHKLFVIPKKGVGPVVVRTVVQAGSLNEPTGMRGYSHFLEHLTFDGSKFENKILKPMEFIKKIASLGGDANAETDSKTTSFYFNLFSPTAKKLFESINNHAFMLKHPNPSKAQFEKEKEVVIQEIKTVTDNPYSEGFGTLINSFLNLKDCVKGEFVIGLKDTIKNAKWHDVKAYHDSRYCPNRMNSVVVGDVNPESIAKMFDKAFVTPEFIPIEKPAFYSPKNLIKPQNISYIINENVNTPFIFIGHLGPKNNEYKARYAIDLLSTILSNNSNRGRLDKAVQDLGYSSVQGAKTFSNDSNANSIILALAQLCEPKEQQFLDNYRKVFSDIKQNPIQKDELLTAKNIIKDLYSQGAEKNSTISSMADSSLSLGNLDEYRTYNKNLDEIDVDYINKIANKYFNPDTMHVSCLQSPKQAHQDIAFTGKIIDTKDISQIKLPNKINVLMNENLNNIRGNIDFIIRSNYLPAKAGVKDILANMINTETKNLSAEEVDKYKTSHGLFNILIDSEKCGLRLSSNSLKESLPSAINLFKDMITNPELSKENFENAKAKYILDIQDYMPTTNDRASESIYKNVKDSFTKREMKKDCKNITLNDVKNYYYGLMRKPVVDVFLTAPIKDSPELKDNILKRLSSFKLPVSNKDINISTKGLIDKKQVLVQILPDKPTSSIAQIYHMQTKNTKEDAALYVLNQILGGGLSSRLFLDLRNKQKLAYTVMSAISPKYLNQKDLYLYIETGSKDANNEINNNIEKSLLGFEKHINKLIKTKVTQKELDAAKLSFINSTKQNTETTASQADFTTTSKLMYGDINYYNKLIKEVKNLKVNDIKNFAKEYLTKPPIVSITTSKDVAQKEEAFLKSRGEYKLFTNDMD